MLDIFIKIVATSILSISGHIVTKNILDYKRKIFNLKNIFIFSLVIAIVYWLFAKDYNFITSLVLYIMLILVNKIVFDEDMVKTVIITTVSMILIAASDMIASIFLLNIVDAETVRVNPYIMLIGNSVVAVIANVLSKIRPIRNVILKFINKFEYKKHNNSILFLILIFLLMSILIYVISNNYSFTIEYWIAVSAIIIFFSLSFIFIKESNNYIQLKTDYIMLFDYFKGLEEWIENERLTVHEHKNQLATIKSMTKNSKINNYIDGILKFQLNVEDNWIDELKYIPKGGLKGLLYYKLISANNNKLSIFVNINANVNNVIKKLDLKNLRDLTQVIGIYFDNAIEASMNTKEKKLSLEMYICKNELNIVICNSINGVILLDKIDNKNYSTKGKNRGNGLFYVKKVLSESSVISSTRKVINNYFMQKIIIKK